eukprot:snap_masked-scaffold_3-processed-gene-13.1-mRNA-1 protein AED:1.00 eAED:1.00 QI:0/0/0/0/1/1/2/0/369
MYKNANNRWACDCNVVPACETCSGPHLSKYHDQIFASIMRSQRRLDLRLRSNKPSTEQSIPKITQWTKENKLVGLTVSTKEHVLREFQVKISVMIVTRIIDTCAEVCVISLELFNLLSESWRLRQDEDCRIKGVDSSNIDIVGGVPIILEIGNLVFWTRVVIVENSTALLILEMDILGGAIVDNKSNKLSFGSEVVDIFGIQLYEIKLINSNEKAMYFLSSDSDLVSGLVEKTKKNENILGALQEEVDTICKIKLKNAKSKEEEDKIKQEKDNMLQILNKHEVLFSEAFQAGKLKVDKMEFQFKEAEDISTPRFMPLRPLSHSEIKVVNKWIEDALQKNFIEQSVSTWRATIFPIPSIVPVRLRRTGGS